MATKKEDSWADLMEETKKCFPKREKKEKIHFAYELDEDQLQRLANYEKYGIEDIEPDIDL